MDRVLRLTSKGLCFSSGRCGTWAMSDQGVSTDPSKVVVVVNWPVSTTVFEPRSFLGFASYYRRFVEGFAKLAAPLQRLVAELASRKSQRTRQVVVENWSEECQRNFELLKAKLTTSPVLACADFSLPFILEVEASYGGLGVVLSQEQNGSVGIRPIAYASRGLCPAQRNMANYNHEITFEGAQIRLKVAAERWKKNYDCHVRDTPLEEGQLVWVRDHIAKGHHKGWNVAG